MVVRHREATRRWTVLLALLGLAVCASSSAASPRPLQTAIVDPAVFTGPDAAAGLATRGGRGRARDQGAALLERRRSGEAPGALSRRRARPSRRTTGRALDAQLRLVRAHGLEPIVYIAAAPTWAIDAHRRRRPSRPAAVPGLRARRRAALLGRGYAGCPRVRYWQAWNEPNKVGEPGGQGGGGGLVPGARERVRRERAHGPGKPRDRRRPLAVRDLDRGRAADVHARPALRLRRPSAPPDLLDERPLRHLVGDPYTAGGPTHRVAGADDVSVAELPEMKTVLDAAVRAGHVRLDRARPVLGDGVLVGQRSARPGGVPASLEGRWVAEALYRMWSAGVSLVTWFTLRDQPLRTSPYQSGLYYLGPAFADGPSEAGADGVPVPVRRLPRRQPDRRLGAHAAGGAAPFGSSSTCPAGWTHVSRPCARTRSASSPRRSRRRPRAAPCTVSGATARRRCRSRSRCRLTGSLPAVRRAALRRRPRARRSVELGRQPVRRGRPPAPAAARRRRRRCGGSRRCARADRRPDRRRTGLRARRRGRRDRRASAVARSCSVRR